MRSGQTGKPCKTQELLRSLSIMEREHGPNSRMVAVALTNLSTFGLKPEFGNASTLARRKKNSKVLLVRTMLKLLCGRNMNEWNIVQSHILSFNDLNTFQVTGEAEAMPTSAWAMFQSSSGSCNALGASPKPYLATRRVLSRMNASVNLCLTTGAEHHQTKRIW